MRGEGWGVGEKRLSKTVESRFFNYTYLHTCIFYVIQGEMIMTFDVTY